MKLDTFERKVLFHSAWCLAGSNRTLARGLSLATLHARVHPRYKSGVRSAVERMLAAGEIEELAGGELRLTPKGLRMLSLNELAAELQAREVNVQWH